VLGLAALALSGGCAATDREPSAVGSESSARTTISSQPSEPTTSPAGPTPTATADDAATATVTAAPSDTAPGWPRYEASIQLVTAESLGQTWREGCPVAPDALRLVQVTHATPTGEATTGELVVAAEVAQDVVAVFEQIYAARFPITRMTTIDAYGGNDDDSMAADNTSAFNCRAVTGGGEWSRHAYGVAIDINPLRNPYVAGDVVLPPAGAAYLDRSDVRPGMITAGDVVVDAFISRGFEWGGDFVALKDYQHFAR